MTLGSSVVVPASGQSCPLLYKIASCDPLPSFDPTVRLKHKLLTVKQMKLYNRMLRPLRKLIWPAYAVGFVLRYAVFFVSPGIGRPIAPISFVLQIPLITNTFLFFQYDYAKLLTNTFEMRFLLIMTLLWLISFALGFQDARSWVLVTCGFDFMNAFLLETFFREPWSVFVFAVGSVVFLCALFMGMMVGAIPRVQAFDILSFQEHSLTTHDLLMNAMGTIMMIFCRLSYSSYKTLWRHRHQVSNRTRSSGYYTRIKLQLHVGQGIANLAATSSPVKVDENRASSVKVLVCMELARKYSSSIDPGATIVPWSARQDIRPFQIWLLYFVGVSGLGNMIFVLCPWKGGWTITAIRNASSLGLLCTLAFCAWFWCFVQWQLVRELVTSFNFLFLSVQISLFHICACDMSYYEWTTCCALLSSWIWMHWVLMLDTICPSSKHKLRLYPTGLPILIMWLYAVAQLAFSCEIILSNRWLRQNRVFWEHTVKDRIVQYRVAPLMMGRQFTIVIWCSRLLWRCVTQRDPNELIVMQGAVEYLAPTLT